MALGSHDFGIWGIGDGWVCIIGSVWIGDSADGYFTRKLVQGRWVGGQWRSGGCWLMPAWSLLSPWSRGGVDPDLEVYN